MSAAPTPTPAPPRRLPMARVRDLRRWLSEARRAARLAAAQRDQAERSIESLRLQLAEAIEAARQRRGGRARP